MRHLLARLEALEPRTLLSSPGDLELPADAVVVPAAASLLVSLDGNPLTDGGSANFGDLPQGYSGLLVITNSGDAAVSLQSLRLPYNDDLSATSIPPTVLDPSGISISEDEQEPGLWHLGSTVTLQPGESITIRLRASVVGALGSDFAIIGSSGNLFTATAEGEVTFGLAVSLQQGDTLLDEEDRIDFGAVQQGDATSPVTFKITNDFGANLRLSLPSSGNGFITGNFTANNSSSIDLDGGSSEATFSIQLNSASAGQFHRRFNISVQDLDSGETATYTLNLGGVVTAVPTPSAADLAVAIESLKIGKGKAAGAAKAGDAVTVKLRVSNGGSAVAVGAADVNLLARHNGQDLLLLTLSDAVLNLPAGKSKTISAKFTLGADVPVGDGQLLAVVDPDDQVDELDESNNDAAVDWQIEAASIDLAAAITQMKVGKNGQAGDGSGGKAQIALTNIGNVPAGGGVSGRLFAEAVNGGQRTLLRAVDDAAINVKPQKAAKLKLAFTVPKLAQGDYRLVFVLDDFSGLPGLQDANTSNDTATSSLNFQVI